MNRIIVKYSEFDNVVEKIFEFGLEENFFRIFKKIVESNGAYMTGKVVADLEDLPDDNKMRNFALLSDLINNQEELDKFIEKIGRHRLFEIKRPF